MLHLSDPDDGPNPAFEEEQLKLDDVIQFIEEDRNRIQQRMPATAAHQETANEIQKILQERQDSLTSASLQPYFGRLDYLVTDGPSPVTRASRDIEAEDATPRLMTVYLGDHQHTRERNL